MLTDLTLLCRIQRAGSFNQAAALAAEALCQIPVSDGLVLVPGIVYQQHSPGQALQLIAKLQWKF